MKLLIIEDDVNIAQQLAGLSEAHGHQVCATAADEDEALRLAIRDRPGLIIADVDLGEGGDGIEAAIRIRESIDARAMFLTGSCDAATRDRAQHAWPLGFLAKTFDGPTFERKLAGVIGMLESPFVQQYLLRPADAGAAS